MRCSASPRGWRSGRSEAGSGNHRLKIVVRPTRERGSPCSRVGLTECLRGGAKSGTTAASVFARQETLMLPLLLVALSAVAADEPKPAHKPAEATPSHPLAGLKFRPLGPALTSGRVVGFAVDPHNRGHYFVAVASGGVWKTTNAGTSWTPVFDAQGSYSIGCVALDPRNSNVVWVGTGENNSQ